MTVGGGNAYVNQDMGTERALMAAFVVALAASLVVPAEVRADAGDAVVARVGAATVTVRELELRLAAMPAYQRASYGSSAAELRRRYLDAVVVPELLLAQAAARRFGASPVTKQAMARARAGATLRAVRGALGPAAAIPHADVHAYYEVNRDIFVAPERYNLWRILCTTRDAAASVLEAAKKEPTAAKFTELARERSIDRATYLRAGNLGFVSADGKSNEAGVAVEPALVEAAMSVRDGEFVPRPIVEGGNFAVVWRRGTVAATKRTEQDAAPQIRDMLWRARAQKAEEEHVDALRRARLSAVNDAPLATVDVSLPDGAVVPLRRPGQLSPTRAGSNQPK